ncbi:MAG: DUF1326 domain-containing protein [Pseudomonadota bacterium]
MKDWAIKGELILNCNCTVFCPCVVSLGQHPPTEGHCQAWMGVRIDEGHAGKTKLSGLNVAMMLEIPGNMGRGNWTAAAYIDDRATKSAHEKLVDIFSGQARGTTGLFSILVSNFLGAKSAPVSYESDGKKRRLEVPKTIIGEVEPVEGAKPGKEVQVTNTGYWMGPDVTVARANHSKVRAFGRVWDFSGRSAEICQIDWQGP